MEIYSEAMPSPPSSAQREIDIIPDGPVAPFDPVLPDNLVVPRDIPRDITVGHKRLAWARQNLQEVEGHKAP
jgi:hypothetical protein